MKAIDIIDAEWEFLKALPVVEVIQYLTQLGFNEEEAREAVAATGCGNRAVNV